METVIATGKSGREYPCGVDPESRAKRSVRFRITNRIAVARINPQKVREVAREDVAKYLARAGTQRPVERAFARQNSEPERNSYRAGRRQMRHGAPAKLIPNLPAASYDTETRKRFARVARLRNEPIGVVCVHRAVGHITIAIPRLRVAGTGNTQSRRVRRHPPPLGRTVLPEQEAGEITLRVELLPGKVVRPGDAKIRSRSLLPVSKGPGAPPFVFLKGGRQSSPAWNLSLTEVRLVPRAHR